MNHDLVEENDRETESNIWRSFSEVFPVEGLVEPICRKGDHQHWLIFTEHDNSLKIVINLQNSPLGMAAFECILSLVNQSETRIGGNLLDAVDMKELVNLFSRFMDGFPCSE